MAGERLYKVRYSEVDEDGCEASYVGVFPEHGLGEIEVMEKIQLIGHLGEGWVILRDEDIDPKEREGKPIKLKSTGT